MNKSIVKFGTRQIALIGLLALGLFIAYLAFPSQSVSVHRMPPPRNVQAIRALVSNVVLKKGVGQLKKQSEATIKAIIADEAKTRASQDSSRLKVFNPTVVNRDGMMKSKLIVQGVTATIYVYNHQDLISRTILQSSHWEQSQMLQTEQLLSADPKLNLLDIGCNLGVYTILAAKMGRKVVAVDANINNLNRVQASLQDNKISDKVTLLLNAMHQEYKTYLLKHHPSNIGGDFIYEVKEGTANGVKSVTFDDILKVIPFKKTLLKLDIEGSEFAALHKADKFFQTLDIPVVFMEWGVINRDNKDGKVQDWILKFFKKRGYAPYRDAFSKDALNMNHFAWPWDIVWRKTSKK